MFPDSASLFQLQTEMMEAKIDMSVNQSITRVVEQIMSLKQEMHKELHGLRHEVHLEIGGLRSEMHKEISELKVDMNSRFSTLEKDMSAVKERLGMREQIRSELRTRVFDYGFRAGWLLLASLPGVVATAILIIQSLHE